MPTKREPAAGLVGAIRDAKRIQIRAGSRPHRFIGIWAVVVQGRVFVRSWSLKPRSWYRTLLAEPRGALKIGEREVPFRALHTKSERLKAAIDRAYLKKYDRATETQFARDMTRARSRATTTELVLEA